ncbi:hypothetical protein APS56_04050 [Pseudalgibacter alginicilyticus]|uniref:Peptidyl-prolyl cis-trans isomerase n=1 Tax=Pseudalgibacter alginicilyticus TaxID=1736674 RepID=A0A0P0CVE3_9FLAO|nr:FKBP-type peptidyl-prolyl cis-trans isomerase [Pseudalgibacter alginicilyticus]ALJ04362.1 hypothetical protein APS56_04050 [Pseudalgibacter alginicilyticus]
MKLKKIIVAFVCVAMGFIACKKDDEDEYIEVELRDRTEQQITDNDSIVTYLKSHYYNAGTFENTNGSIADLIITEVDGEIPDPENNKLLFGSAALDSIQVTYAETLYNVYYLTLNEGAGETPTFADNVRVNYEGYTLDENVFDSSVNPVEFDLTGAIAGWRKILPLFKTAEGFVENGDGTVSYSNHGAGVMFVPSGLGYFASGSTNISSYSPLVFKFDLFEMQENDHDNDGVPSWKEDLNGDGEFFTTDDDELDDTDGDGTLNIIDTDDDGDGVPTIREDIDGDGDPTNDIGKNGIPRYLDPEETEANIL